MVKPVKRRTPRPKDVIAARMGMHSVERCKGCRLWCLMSAHDLRELARALEQVQAANAAGYCVWCSAPSTRSKRRREADRAMVR